MSPNNSLALSLRGRALERISELEKAVGTQNAVAALSAAVASEQAYSDALANAPDDGHEERWAPCALALARFAKSRGEFAEAAAHATAACSLDPKSATARDMATRLGRLAKGLPEEVEVEATPAAKARKAKAAAAASEEINFIDAGFVSPGPIAGASDMTADERSKVFFDTMRAQKLAKEEEEQAALAMKLARMTPEERLSYETEQSDKIKHDAKKDKVMNKQLGAFGRSPAAVRGRGGRSRGIGSSYSSPRLI